MALKKMLQKLTTPVSELDRDRLRAFCAAVPGTTAIVEARPREHVTVVGEITFVRVVPRAGSPWLEATVNDGTGTVVSMWTGRKKIAGIRGGQRVMLSGRAAPNGPGGRLQFFNPLYELLG